MNAHDGTGFARMMAGDPVGAVEKFRKALELFPEHARSLVGRGARACVRGPDRPADEAVSRTVAAIEALRRGGRGNEANLAEAMYHSVRGDNDRAIEGTSPPVGA